MGKIKTTLETSGEGENYTRNECKFYFSELIIPPIDGNRKEFSKWNLVSSVVLHLPQSLRVYFYIFPTRFECSYTSFSLVSSVFLHLSHQFRVYFYIFPTRFECIFTSFPLVSSVFSGVNKIAPKPKKIMQLLRLRQLHNGVFIKVKLHSFWV